MPFGKVPSWSAVQYVGYSYTRINANLTHFLVEQISADEVCAFFQALASYI